MILAYSGTHYESLIPVLDKDELRSRRIIQKYIKGEDLFSEEEEEAVIITRSIKIQKSQPVIDSWSEDDQVNMNNALNSTRSSYKDDIIACHDNGLDNWRDYHPGASNKKSEYFNNNIAWNNNPNQSHKTISIPINIVESQT